MYSNLDLKSVNSSDVHLLLALFVEWTVMSDTKAFAGLGLQLLT